MSAHPVNRVRVRLIEVPALRIVAGGARSKVRVIRSGGVYLVGYRYALLVGGDVDDAGLPAGDRLAAFQALAFLCGLVSAIPFRAAVGR